MRHPLPCFTPAGHLYNTHVVLDDCGRTAAVYRKVHLFDVDVPNGPVLMESRTTAPGDQVGWLGLRGSVDVPMHLV